MPHPSLQNDFDLALRHHQAGRLEDAARIYRLILAQRPNHPVVLHNLGVISHQTGRIDLAIELIRQSLALEPDNAAAWYNFSNALAARGRLEETTAACRRAIAIRPDFPEALNNLGKALKANGRLDEAIAAYHQVLALRPEFPESLYNLGNALSKKGLWNEAIAAYRRALVFGPNHLDGHINLGNALKNSGELSEAIDAYRQALVIKPDYPQALNNLGMALKEMGQLNDAIAAYRRVISLKPDYAEAHANLAIALLSRGDFLEGWEEHEWRWKCKDFPSPPRNFSQPRWDGSALDGRVLLLHSEQGFGDAIHFIRYLPMVRRRGEQIILECQAELVSLFKTIASGCQVIAKGQALPAFNLHCPLLSLPSIFKTTLEAIPAEVPYLFAEQNLANAWREKLKVSNSELKVGLAWAGNSSFIGDRTRSLSLDRLGSMADTREVTFYSLQKGAAASQAGQPPAGLKLVDISAGLQDFSDTAAVMSLMDLVITTDTSVAHLAGALGRPTWLMLQFVPDFRWLRDREDSPWYPTMRLFRQPALGDWNSVIKAVVDELNALASRLHPTGRAP